MVLSKSFCLQLLVFFAAVLAATYPSASVNNSLSNFICLARLPFSLRNDMSDCNFTCSSSRKLPEGIMIAHSTMCSVSRPAQLYLWR